MPKLKSKNDISWNYDIDGEGDVVLFIHGWGVDRRIWRQQWKHFVARNCVMAIDLPGHGESSWHKGNLTMLAEDIKSIFENEKIKQINIVGSSLGGLVALKIYELYPEVIQRLIFVGSMPKFARSEEYPHGLDVQQMRKMHSQLHRAYPSIVDIFFRSLFTKEERQSRRYKWLQRFRRDAKPPIEPALEEYLNVLEHEDLRDVLSKVHVPIQFINGKGDEICTPDTVAYLKQVVPHARFDDFDKVGHFPFLSKAYEFNEALQAFLLDGHEHVKPN